MNLSLGSWAFCTGPYSRNPISFERAAKRLSEAGYDGIELWGFPPHASLDRYPTSGSRRELTAFLENLELGVSGYAADLTEVNPLIPSHARKYLDQFQNNLELCAEIGSPSLSVDTAVADGALSAEESALAFGCLAEVWSKAAQLAWQAAIRLVWDAQPGLVFHNPSQVIALHEAVNHQNFKIQFDIAHADVCTEAGARPASATEAPSGGVMEFLSQLGERIGHIHLRALDDTAHTDAIGRHHPFEESRIDFRALGPKLLALPGIEWWCIDLRSWPRAWELAEPSREFVARLFRSSAHRHAV